MGFVRSSLPAAAFFLLLGAAAAIGYQVGIRHAGSAADHTDEVFTCSMHPQVRQTGPGLCPICHMELVPLDALPDDDGTGITIDPVVVQNMGVRVAEVTRGPVDRSVRAFGVLREAQTRQRDVALKFPGFVEELFADTEGMTIRRGDPLFSIYSAELVVAQEELIAARKSGDPDLLAAARQKLLLWDVPAAMVDELQELDAARRTLPWPSPVDGVLTRRDVVEGAPAMMNQTLLRVVDLSVLWLDAQIPESQLALVRVGQSATATFPTAPGTALEGRVVFESPTLDETTRTATVRVEIENPGARLKPGMFARLRLGARLAEDAVLVPAEAVLDTGARRVAWVALGAGRFEPRDVTVGFAGDAGSLQVLEGLLPGERVVVSGQFLIDAESRLREGTRRMSEQGLVEAGDPPPARPTIDVDDAVQERIDALLGAYLAAARELALDRSDDASWRALGAAAAAAREVAPEVLLEDLTALEQAVASAPAGLDARRDAFHAASRGAIAVFESAPPRTGDTDALLVVHCPMVPGDWVQDREPVANPYAGSTMLRCGDVVRRIARRESGR